jgi:hypothetical protein
MINAQRFSIVWPILIILVAIGWFMHIFGVLPAATTDIIGRSWPAILVALGLMLLLGRRVRYGNLAAFIVSIVLVGGMVSVAYSQQAGKLRTENQKVLNQPIEAQTTSLKIVVTTLTTLIEITPGDQTAIVGEFMGSKESKLAADYQTDGTVGTFTVTESQSNTVPSLDAIGKGKLTIKLPTNVIVEEVTITGREGDTTFDASTANIKNLNLSIGAGNVTVRLPDQSGVIANIKTGRGDATVVVPANIAANVTLRGSAANSAQYNQADYILDIQKVLNSRRASAPQQQITVDATGQITIQ